MESLRLEKTSETIRSVPTRAQRAGSRDSRTAQGAAGRIRTGREDGHEVRGEEAFSTLRRTRGAPQLRPTAATRGISCGHRAQRTGGERYRHRQPLRRERFSARGGVCTGGGSSSPALLQRQLRTGSAPCRGRTDPAKRADAQPRPASCTEPRARPLRRTSRAAALSHPAPPLRVVRGGAVRLSPSRRPPRKAVELRSAQPGPSRRDAAAPRPGGGRPGG